MLRASDHVRSNRSYLVQNLILRSRKRNDLLMKLSLVFQLELLAPAVEGAGNDDFVGGVRPAQRMSVSLISTPAEYK